jgi:hypothetical protein
MVHFMCEFQNAFECPNYENGNRKISDNTRSGQQNISDLLENELRTEDACYLLRRPLTSYHLFIPFRQIPVFCLF